MYFQDEASDDIKMYYIMCDLFATGRMSFILFFLLFVVLKLGGSGRIILYDEGERCRKLCQLYDKFMFVFEMRCFVYISEKKILRGLKYKIRQCIDAL